MNSDEQDDLYHLLGRARKIEPSPFFVRNVLRAVRSTPISPWRLWFAFPRVATLAALLLIFVGTFLFKDHSETTLISALKNPTDFEVVNNLDDLIAYADTSLWTSENSNY